VTRVFIGVSWPYANGPQHLGHLASTYVPADLFARFHRLRGDEVLMVSGSDMHGTPILVAAEKAGTGPAELAARFHALNKDALTRLGVSFDVFTTTHTVLHERTVDGIFLALLEGGFIERRTADAAYCPTHRRFLPDRYLEGTCPHCGFEKARGDECDHCGRPLEPKQLGHPRCALDGTPAEFRPSEHFYLELDRLQPKLAEYLGRQKHRWRPGVLRVAENFLAEGLHPTAITRDLEWGVPIPLDGYATKRIYVWFEALIGYLSAAQEWAVRSGRPEAWHRYWDEREPAQHYYFVGKDNKFHHTVVWPSMLLGVGGLHLPDDVPANEWMTLGGRKVSKSRTEEEDAFLPSLLAKYPPDQIRFYAALLAPQNHDTELDWAEFHKVREEILANQLGNLVQRALVFARDRYEGRAPTPPNGWRFDAPNGLAAHLRAVHERVTGEFEKVRLKEALDVALEEVREANRRYQESKPWALEGEARDRAVVESLWSVRAVATWLAPVLPFSSAEVFRMLGFADAPGPGDWDRALEPVPAGQLLGEIRPLFPRAGTAPSSGRAPSVSAPPPADGIPLAIRAGRILEATPHPSADRLYVLRVDVGSAEPRTLVAGLRTSYTPEELTGRDVVLLSNLAPRTIRGIPSQGMVLAAEAGTRAVLLEPPAGTAPGSFIEGGTDGDRSISHDEFSTVSLTVGRSTGAPEHGRTPFDVGGQTVLVRGSWPPDTVGIVRRAAADASEGELLTFGSNAPIRPSEPTPVGAKVR
jgi:methionyl-tRNA synthetase